tara:strand:+ start:147138 stop:147275 length:138 start_codon:yes stop_codon:yes gene_type:complete
MSDRTNSILKIGSILLAYGLLFCGQPLIALIIFVMLGAFMAFGLI